MLSRGSSIYFDFPFSIIWCLELTEYKYLADIQDFPYFPFSTEINIHPCMAFNVKSILSDK